MILMLYTGTPAAPRVVAPKSNKEHILAKGQREMTT